MHTTTLILPGVQAIGWLDCQHLPRRVDLQGICHKPVAIFTTIKPIEFFDEPQCECKTEKESGHSSETAILKFLCGEMLPLSHNVGFVVTDVTGRSFLIGSKEPPFPRIKVERTCGTPDGDAAGYKYAITHNAIRTLVDCIVSY